MRWGGGAEPPPACWPARPPTGGFLLAACRAALSAHSPKGSDAPRLAGTLHRHGLLQGGRAAVEEGGRGLVVVVVVG